MKYINYILILAGAVVAIYAKTGTEQNQYILIGGIMMLMAGIYRISKTIPSRDADERNYDNNENEM
jgi:LPXTG-motif cell wall-anchored protein